MKLETFFEKFDQLADAPEAVAKMRELVLDLAAARNIQPAAQLRRSAMFIENPTIQQSKLQRSGMFVEA